MNRRLMEGLASIEVHADSTSVSIESAEDSDHIIDESAAAQKAADRKRKSKGA